MEARAFLSRIPALIRVDLPADLRRFTTANGYGLIKVLYGNPKLHYEVNHQPRSLTVEVGLHFEADHFTNARLLGAFRVHAKSVARELPGARLEEWDKGWCRVWEPMPYESLDREAQTAVAERLARYITVLEPLLRDELPADVPWKVAAPAPRRAEAVSAKRTTRSRRGG